MKKYLYVIVTRKDGTDFTNHLKLSEVSLISQIAQENEKITVWLMYATESHYKQMFG